MCNILVYIDNVRSKILFRETKTKLKIMPPKHQKCTNICIWREITWLSQTAKFQHFRPRWRNDLPRPLLFSSFATRFRFNFTYMCDYKPPLTLTSVNVFNQQHIKHILIAPSKTKQKTTSYLATLYLLQEKKKPCLRFTDVLENQNDNLLSLEDLINKLRFPL